MKSKEIVKLNFKTKRIQSKMIATKDHRRVRIYAVVDREKVLIHDFNKVVSTKEALDYILSYLDANFPKWNQ